MNKYICSRGHLHPSQFAADNCYWCRRMPRPKIEINKFAPLDREHMEIFEPSAVVEYCRSDVEILRAGIRCARAAQKRLCRGRSWTSGGSAVGALRKHEYSLWCLLKKYRLEVETVEWLLGLKIIWGGRNEVGRYGKIENVHRYDIGSSYPRSYGEGDLPIGFGRIFNTKNLTENPSNLYCSWRRDRRDVPAPLLGVAGKGSGEICRWVTREQYDWLRTLDEIKNLKIHKALYPALYVEYGTEFSRALYTEKENGRAHWCVKPWLNSNHGKASSHAIQEFFIPNPAWPADPDAPAYISQQDPMPPDDPDEKWWAEPYMQPITASWILGRAELRLSKALIALRDAGFGAYYWDTDCVRTNADPKQFDKILRKIGQKIGDEMGEWKYEGFEKECIYAAPKLYCEGKHRRAKGVKAKSVNFPELLLGPQVLPREGITGAKSSLIKGKKAEKIKTRRTIKVVSRGKIINPKTGVCIYEKV